VDSAGQQNWVPEVTKKRIHCSDCSRRNLHADSNICRLYNSEERSDVTLKLPNDPNGERSIHAHRRVLTRASHYFYVEFNEQGINVRVRRHDQRRLLLLRLLTGSKGATHAEFQIDEEHEEMLIPALRYIYGFTFPREGEAEMPKSLYEIARFGALARRFGISDLEQWASDTAKNLLNDCLCEETKLEEFLAFDRFHPADSRIGLQVYSHGVKYIWDNVKLIRYEPAFRRLLEVEPSLAMHLLCYAMDRVD
jgi:hypothetical protein